jgi:hypothetical protein
MSWKWQRTVGAVGRAGTRGQRQDIQVFDTQRFHPNHGIGHSDNRVERAHFVDMNGVIPHERFAAAANLTTPTAPRQWSRKAEKRPGRG